MGACLSQPAAEDPFAYGAKQAASGGTPVDDGPEIKPHSGPPQALHRSLLGRATSSDITRKYDLGHVLGRGAFGVTRLATDKQTGQPFACKSMLKARLAGTGEGEDVRTELDIMLHLSGHPNIVKLVDSYEDAAYVHLVLEFCGGGDLVHRITNKGSYTERDAAAVIRTLLEVLAYCHDLGCMHRDIKPDNCLMLDDDDAAPLKLADWGFGTFVHPGKKLTAVAGTCYYIAPEVLMESYNEKADIWSTGAMLFVLLSGSPPFYAPRDEDVFTQIMDNAVPDMTRDPWPSISDAAEDAVRQMMTFSDAARPSAREMLKHEWIREGGVAGDNVLQPEVLHRMRSFAAMNAFRRQAAMVIASHLPFDEIRGLKELFESMDSDGSGTLTVEEIGEAMKSRGCSIYKNELAKLLKLADANGDGVLDYTEFIAATLQERQLQEEDSLTAAFKHFDADGDGQITLEELRAALSGSHIGKEQATKLLAAADSDGDGTIDYVEFTRMMTCGDGKTCPGHRHALNVGPAHANGPARAPGTVAPMPGVGKLAAAAAAEVAGAATGGNSSGSDAPDAAAAVTGAAGAADTTRARDAVAKASPAAATAKSTRDKAASAARAVAA